MGRTLILFSALVFLVGIVTILGTGCPPENEDLQKIIVKALSGDGCRGCDSCNPEEGEVEGEPEGEFAEGEPLEGEIPAEGEGEIVVEGEPIEGEGEVFPEGEGEILIEGEGEVINEGELVEGEVLEGEGETPSEGEILPEGEGELFSLMLGLGAVSPEYVHGTITPDPEPTELCPPLEGQPWCGLYTAGTEVHLTPLPNEGYEFDYWTEDLSGSDVPGIVVMDANRHVKAEFMVIIEGEGESVEGEILVEGEGESPTEGEKEGEIAEGEAAEGEPVEGEGEGEGEASEGETAIYTPGEEVLDTTAMVGENGGTIEGPVESPVEEITLAFPANALPSEVAVTLGHDTGELTIIQGLAGPTVAFFSSGPVLQFENPVLVTFHYDAPEDNDIPIPYRIETDGELSLLTLISLDVINHTATFATYCPCKFTWILDSQPTAIDTSKIFSTGFESNQDGFQITNAYGSQYNIGGECFGMTGFAQWYYRYHLNDGRFYPQFMDHIFGYRDIKLPSGSYEQVPVYGQALIATRAFNSINQLIANLTHIIDVFNLPTVQCTIILNTLMNGRGPVLLGLVHPVSQEPGHSVLAYGATNDGIGVRIFIYDPNYPGESREIHFNGLTWDSYAGYVNIASYGNGSLSLREPFESILTDAKNDFVLDEEAVITVTSHSNGQIVPTSVIDLKGTVSSEPATGRIDINVNGIDRVCSINASEAFDQEIELQPGPNRLLFRTFYKDTVGNYFEIPNNLRTKEFILVSSSLEGEGEVIVEGEDPIEGEGEIMLEGEVAEGEVAEGEVAEGEAPTEGEIPEEGEGECLFLWEARNNGLVATNVSSIAIDENNFNKMYLGTNNGVFKSINRGLTWFVSGLTEKNIIRIVINPFNSSLLYAGVSGEGVQKSENGGESWSSVNNGLPSLNAQSLAIFPDGSDRLYVGIDNSGIYRTLDGGKIWTSSSAGGGHDARQIIVNPVNNDIAYASVTEWFKKTIDGGNSWFTSDTGLPSRLSFGLAMDPSNPEVLYVGPWWTEGFGVYKTTNGASSWFSSKDGLPEGSTVNALAVDPRNSNTVYAGVADDRGVYVSTDGGTYWKSINEGLTHLTIPLNAISICSSNPTVVWVGTQGGGVFVLTCDSPI